MFKVYQILGEGYAIQVAEADTIEAARAAATGEDFRIEQVAADGSSVVVK